LGEKRETKIPSTKTGPNREGQTQKRGGGGVLPGREKEKTLFSQTKKRGGGEREATQVHLSNRNKRKRNIEGILREGGGKPECASGGSAFVQKEWEGKPTITFGGTGRPSFPLPGLIERKAKKKGAVATGGGKKRKINNTPLLVGKKPVATRQCLGQEGWGEERVKLFRAIRKGGMGKKSL